MADHRHKLRLKSKVAGYDRDARVYQCKKCPHVETRYSKGTRKRGNKGRQR